MVRKKTPEQVEKEKQQRLKSTVLIDPIEDFARAASSEFQSQQDSNILATQNAHIDDTVSSHLVVDDNIAATISQHDSDIGATSKRAPKETHLHVVMHPDIKAALKKLAEQDRRKVAETTRDLIISGLRQRGIEL